MKYMYVVRPPANTINIPIIIIDKAQIVTEGLFSLRYQLFDAMLGRFLMLRRAYLALASATFYESSL